MQASAIERRPAPGERRQVPEEKARPHSGDPQQGQALVVAADEMVGGLDGGEAQRQHRATAESAAAQPDEDDAAEQHVNPPLDRDRPERPRRAEGRDEPLIVRDTEAPQYLESRKVLEHEEVADPSLEVVIAPP